MLTLPHPAALASTFRRPGETLSAAQAEQLDRSHAQAPPAPAEVMSFQLFDATAFAMVTFLREEYGDPAMGAILSTYLDGRDPFTSDEGTQASLAAIERDFAAWLTQTIPARISPERGNYPAPPTARLRGRSGE